MNALTNKIILRSIMFCLWVLCTLPPLALAANYPLQVLIPRAAGTTPDAGNTTLSADHFTLWAYPGITYRMRAAVVGGDYPYTFALSSQPSGMTIDSQGVIVWTNPQASDASITLTVTDASGTQAQSIWGVTVDANKFRFLDCDAGTSGSGTVASPWRNISSIPSGSNGLILYFRDCTASGYYNALDKPRSGGDQVQFNASLWSQQWLAYPGERPILNIGFQVGGDLGTMIRFQGSPAAFIGFQSINGHIKHINPIYDVHYGVYWDNEFRDLSGTNGTNPAFIMTENDPGGSMADYNILQNNDFHSYGHLNGGNGGACVKIYAQYKLLIEDNICRDATGVSDIEGFALKGGTMDRITVRHNTIYNVPAHPIGGNNHTLSNAEILFNRVYNASENAVRINQDGLITTPIYIYRNTFIGRVEVDNIGTTSGPFYFYNNVIVSSDPVGGCEPGSRIYCGTGADSTRISATNNLEGTNSSGITDTTGNLTSGYSSYLGTQGHQLGTGASTSGHTFYVDQNHPSANDSNTGTSESAPWLTFQRAMQPSIIAGDTVYVKNGTYAAGGSAFIPTNSGTVNAPIAYRAYTPGGSARHTPILTRSGSDPFGANRPVISSTGRNYIIWDGFTLGPWTNAEAYGSVGNKAVGNVFENLTIDKGSSTLGTSTLCGNGNYTGIFLQLTSLTTIRNNTIRNVNYTNCAAWNAVGIVSFDSDNLHIHNNEIYNTNTGINDKENGVSNVHELNYIHDIAGPGMFFEGYVTSRCGTCPVQNNIVRNNVFVNVDAGVNPNINDPSIQSNIDVYNNTFYNAGIGFVMYGAIPDVDVYNNIFVISGTGSYSSIKLINPPSDWASDYNTFRVLAGGSVRFNPPNAYETLPQWQVRGFDLNSLTSDPLFAGPFPATTPAAFQLQNTSPAQNAGRMGGIASGTSVNIGAYATGSEVIGIDSATPTGDATAPTVSLITPASGATISGTAVTVSATASDNVAVSGVQFLLDGANVGSEDTASPYSITWNTTTVTNGSHSLSARARDAAGNQTTSTSVTVMVNNITGDTTAPAVPTNLTATAISSTQINLAWTASTDNVGVSGYRIYRDSVQIATTTSTSYSNTGLSPGTTYTYTIAAYDAANNVSAQSTGAQATTQTPPDITPPNRPTGVTVQPGP